MGGHGIVTGRVDEPQGKPEPMRILYDRECAKRDTYTYRINRGGELRLFMDPMEQDVEDTNIPDRTGEMGTVQIVFVNGYFQEAHVPFRGKWTRSAWHVLGAVSEEITRLEAQYAKEGV